MLFLVPFSWGTIKRRSWLACFRGRYGRCKVADLWLCDLSRRHVCRRSIRSLVGHGGRGKGCGRLLGVCGRHYRILMIAYFFVYEAFEAFDVLCVDFDVVVACAFDPQWLHGLLTLVVNGNAMWQVDYFVVRAVYDEHERDDFACFVNALI